MVQSKVVPGGSGTQGAFPGQFLVFKERGHEFWFADPDGA